MADNESEDFRRFLQTRRAEVAQAYVQGDAAPLRDMATAHDPASFLGPGGTVLHGAMRVSEAHAEGAKSFGAGGSTRLEVLHHCASEGLAFWTGYQHASVVLHGKSEAVAMKLRITEVFRSESGEWKLVHRHADMQGQDQAQPARPVQKSSSLPFPP